MADKQRQYIAVAITLVLTILLIVLISLILWQMWESRAAFGIFAPPIIIALLCFIFAALRFVYSCIKFKSAVDMYTKLIDNTIKYLWLNQATAHDIHERHCVSTTCSCSCNEEQCSCCFENCSCNCRGCCFNCASISDQPVYIWILRILFAVFLYPIWIFVIFCVAFRKFETTLWDPSSIFQNWLRSNEVTPFEHFEREAEELEKKSKKKERTSQFSEKSAY